MAEVGGLHDGQDDIDALLAAESGKIAANDAETEALLVREAQLQRHQLAEAKDKRAADYLATKDTDGSDTAGKLTEAENVYAAAQPLKRLQEFVEKNGKPVDDLSAEFKAAYKKALGASDQYKNEIVPGLEKNVNTIDDLPEDLDPADLTPEFIDGRLGKIIEAGADGKAIENAVVDLKKLSEQSSDKDAILKRVYHFCDMEMENILGGDTEKFIALREEARALVPDYFSENVGTNLWLPKVFGEGAYLNLNAIPGIIEKIDSGAAFVAELRFMLGDVDGHEELAEQSSSVLSKFTFGLFGDKGKAKKNENQVKFLEINKRWKEEMDKPHAESAFNSIRYYGGTALPAKISDNVNDAAGIFDGLIARANNVKAAYKLAQDNASFFEGLKEKTKSGREKFLKIYEIKKLWYASK